jgi:hypothetical protein
MVGSRRAFVGKSRPFISHEGPLEKDGGVWMRWAATYTLASAPDCRMEGEERAVFAGDRIRRLEDSITDWLNDAAPPSAAAQESPT